MTQCLRNSAISSIHFGSLVDIYNMTKPPEEHISLTQIRALLGIIAGPATSLVHGRLGIRAFPGGDRFFMAPIYVITRNMFTRRCVLVTTSLCGVRIQDW